MALQNGKKVEVELRRYRILEMKLAGATERQIAEREGISHGLVNRDVQKILGDMAKQNVGNADQMRALQMERYNALLLRQWQLAMAGDKDAITIVLRLLDRINQINGIIPDRPLINMSLEQNMMAINNGPVTFKIETASDDTDTNISETESIPEATGRDIFEG